MKVVRSALVIVGLLVLCQSFAQAAEKPAAKKPAANKPAAKPSAVEPEESWTCIQLALAPPSLQLVGETENIKGLRLQIYGSNKDVSALDLGLFNRTNGRFHGVGFGLANFAYGDSKGLQFAVVNQGKADFAGAQFGLVNLTGKMHGVQLGLVNIADDMTGLQIGLWNQINSKDLWYIIPIVNWKF